MTPSRGLRPNRSIEVVKCWAEISSELCCSQIRNVLESWSTMILTAHECSSLSPSPLHIWSLPSTISLQFQNVCSPPQWNDSQLQSEKSFPQVLFHQWIRHLKILLVNEWQYRKQTLYHRYQLTNRLGHNCLEVLPKDLLSHLEIFIFQQCGVLLERPGNQLKWGEVHLLS